MANKTCIYEDDSGRIKVSLDNPTVAARMKLGGFAKQTKQAATKPPAKKTTAKNQK